MPFNVIHVMRYLQGESDGNESLNRHEGVDDVDNPSCRYTCVGHAPDGHLCIGQAREALTSCIAQLQRDRQN